jgi:NAD-dependent dihydropyrimidine dehydrogenase PreA subunit
MSKTWYPVIDYGKCTECGACTNKCTHEVYDLKKVPTPVVVLPENCIQGCHGCGNLCPANAIQYVGEQRQESENCGCSCGNESGGCC